MVVGGGAVSRLAAVVIILAMALALTAVIYVIGCGGRTERIKVTRLPIASQRSTVGIGSHGVGEAECISVTSSIGGCLYFFLRRRQSWLGSDWIGSQGFGLVVWRARSLIDVYCSSERSLSSVTWCGKVLCRC